MIVDTHVHMFQSSPSWSSLREYSPETLVARMDGPFLVGKTERRVDRALVMPFGFSSDPNIGTHRAHHEFVVTSCRRYPDRLVGHFMYNPHLGVEEGVRELERLVQEEGFRAVKLHPTFHAFFPHRSQDLVWPIIDAAGRLDIGVLIHTGDAPFALPIFVGPVAEAFPQVRIVIAHFGTQRISFADEAVEVARLHDNVWIETSCAHLTSLKQGVRVLGANKLIHGTDAPFHDMQATIRNIEALGEDEPYGMRLSENDLERIYGGNAQEVFRIS